VNQNLGGEAYTPQQRIQDATETELIIQIIILLIRGFIDLRVGKQ
jgi:hypothetical protein